MEKLEKLRAIVKEKQDQAYKDYQFLGAVEKSLKILEQQKKQIENLSHGMEERGGNKFGICPMCKKEDRPLVFTIGSHRGCVWSGYICPECLEKARKKQEGRDEQE